MVAWFGRCGGSVLLVALAMAPAGCVSLKSASSGQIGCPQKDIVISNDSSGWGSRTWTAECHGKKFFCSAVASGNNTEQVNCKEAVADEKGPSPAAAAAAPAVSTPAAAPVQSGCQYDAQCKGDRVCVKGECVDPAPTSPPVAPASAPAP